MSMNIVLVINNEEIEIPQTQTKETSLILGVDVNKQVEENGFYQIPYHVNSKKDKELFQNTKTAFIEFLEKKKIQYELAGYETDYTDLIKQISDEKNNVDFSFR